MRRAARWMVPFLLLGVVMVKTTSAAGRAATVRTEVAPTNGRILFTHCEDACQIYTANPDGSAVEQVTSDGDSFQGDWSPDGERIAYASFASGDLAIWIVNADGSEPQQLTPDDPDSDDLAPRFTADGQWILYQNCFGNDCDGGISAVRPDGSGMHEVTPNSHDSYNSPEPSPDGTRMAYMRWHVDGVKMAIYVSSTAGSGQHRVSPVRLEGWQPDWSPTGERIAFASHIFMDRPAPSVFTVLPTGVDVQALTHPPFPHADIAPSYSPDGQQVIFESDRRYGDFCCHDLFVVPATGGTPKLVHLPFDAYEARWGIAPTQPATNSARYAMLRFTVGGAPSAFIRVPAMMRRRP